MKEHFTTIDGRDYKLNDASAVQMLALANAGMQCYKADAKGNVSLAVGTKEGLAAVESFWTEVFEHISVKIDGKWCNVKEKDADVWWPMHIDEDYDTLNKLIVWFMSDIVIPVFTKSNELTQKSDSLESSNKETSNLAAEKQ